MKGIYKILILLVWPLSIFSQNVGLSQRITKLEHQLASFDRDTQLVVVYCRKAHEFQLTNIDTVTFCIKKALQYSKLRNWTKGQILALHEQANMYVFDGQFNNVMDLSRQALTLSKSIDWPLHEAHALRFIGDCHAEFKQWDSAMVYYDRARAIFKKVKADSMLVRSYVNYGDLYRGKRAFKKADAYYQVALNHYKQTNSNFGLGLVYWSMGYQKVMQNELDTALVYFQRVLEYSIKINSVFGQAAMYNEIAGLELARKDYPQTLLYVQKALESSKKYKSKQQISIAYIIAKNAHEAMGDSKRALAYSDLALSQRDSVFYDIFSNRIELYKLQYERDLALQIQNAENKTRNRLLIIIALLTIIALITFNNKKLRQKNKEIGQALLKGQTIERKRVASELHDNLGGLLSAMKHTVEAIDLSDLHPQERYTYEKLVDMLKNLTVKVRQLSHNLLPEELENQGLIPALQSLVVQLNLAKKTKFELVVSTGISRFGRTVEFNLYTICLELCNNILKYSDAQKAQIELIDRVYKIDLIVSDDGKGFDSTDRSDGSGLKNVKDRAETLNGNMKIHSIPNEGTIVSIAIPLIHSGAQT